VTCGLCDIAVIGRKVGLREVGIEIKLIFGLFVQLISIKIVLGRLFGVDMGAHLNGDMGLVGLRR